VTLLADVVQTSTQVAGTASRLAKTRLIADCLRKLDPDEVEFALPYLSGDTRQGKLADQRAQLDLQVRLLAEQKTAKRIAWLEALRRDLPEVTNRHDAEAAAMEHATDPPAMLDALETLHEPVPAEADHEPLEQSDAGDGRAPAGR